MPTAVIFILLEKLNVSVTANGRMRARMFLKVKILKPISIYPQHTT